MGVKIYSFIWWYLYASDCGTSIIQVSGGGGGSQQGPEPGHPRIQAQLDGS